MGGGSFKNRGQIDTRNAQVCQITDFRCDSRDIPAIKLIICHAPLRPGKNILFGQRSLFITEAFRKDLIPYGILHPIRRHIDIRRIHPGKRKILQPYIACHKGTVCSDPILQIVTGFIPAPELKEITAAFIRRKNRYSPPFVVFQFPYLQHLLRMPLPRPGPAEFFRLHGIFIIQENPIHLLSGLDLYHQFRFIFSVAHIILASVINTT